MCAGAIVLSRIDRVVFGARDPKAGFGGSLGEPAAGRAPQPSGRRDGGAARGRVRRAAPRVLPRSTEGLSRPTQRCMRCADGLVDLLGDVRHDAGHRLEVARQHHDRGDGRRRHDRRRAPVVLHDRDLAEEVARPEVREVLAVLRDGDACPSRSRRTRAAGGPARAGGTRRARRPRPSTARSARAPCGTGRGTAGAVPSASRPPVPPLVEGILPRPAVCRHPRAGAHRAVARLGDGGVPERTNGTASKAVRGLNRPSRVQITPPPP